MRYRLRTLFIVLALVQQVLAGAWFFIAEALFPTARPHGQECGPVAAACTALDVVAAMAIAGVPNRPWHQIWAIAALVTTVIAAYFTYGWFQWNRGGWDNSNYIIFPPVWVAVAFNAMLLSLLAAMRFVIRST
jgi:hypothetical protein